MLFELQAEVKPLTVKTATIHVPMTAMTPPN